MKAVLQFHVVICLAISLSLFSQSCRNDNHNYQNKTKSIDYKKSFEKEVDELFLLHNKLNDSDHNIKKSEVILPVAFVSVAVLSSIAGYVVGKGRGNPTKIIDQAKNDQAIRELKKLLKAKNNRTPEKFSDLLKLYKKFLKTEESTTAEFQATQEAIHELVSTLQASNLNSPKFQEQIAVHQAFMKQFNLIKDNKKHLTLEQIARFEIIENMVSQSKTFFERFAKHIEFTEEILEKVGNGSKRIKIQEFLVNLPGTNTGRAYNGSIVEYRGEKMMFYRNDYFSFKEALKTLPPGKTEIKMVKLDDTMSPISEPVTVLSNKNKKFSFSNPEDPRIHIIDDKIHITFNDTYIKNSPNRRMKKAVLDYDGESFQVNQLDEFLDSPGNFKLEKNWVPFVHQGNTHLIYSIDPLVVYKFDEITRKLAQIKTEVSPQVQKKLQAWKEQFGSPRGGSNLIPVDDGFVGVFHSSSKPNNKPVDSWQKRIYVNGFFKIKINDSGNVEIVDLASKPIFSEHYNEGKNIIFSSGLSKVGDDIFISGGVSDSQNFVWKFNFNEIFGDTEDALGKY